MKKPCQSTTKHCSSILLSGCDPEIVRSKSCNSYMVRHIIQFTDSSCYSCMIHREQSNYDMPFFYFIEYFLVSVPINKQKQCFHVRFCGLSSGGMWSIFQTSFSTSGLSCHLLFLVLPHPPTPSALLFSSLSLSDFTPLARFSQRPQSQSPSPSSQRSL